MGSFGVTTITGPLRSTLAGQQTPTQVTQALLALDIEFIFALSPQANGRIERLWGTF
jgi:hypothetical protein